MAAPELQRLAMEAKSAAAILKYLPVTPDLLPEVVETLKTLSAHTAWPARAAALVFVQVTSWPLDFSAEPDVHHHQEPCVSTSAAGESL